MKAHCEQGLRKIVAAALLIGAAQGYAQAQQGTPAGQVSTAAAQTTASAAETVVAVRIVTEDGRVLSEAPAGLPISIGKPLDREQVAESIRTLYRTGDYADLRAIATRVDGGVRIDFVAEQPKTLWNEVAPNEYGFYANVNPEVDHPRWSQAKERRLGEFSKRPTLMFNGYGDQVASLYNGMDLRRYY